MYPYTFFLGMGGYEIFLTLGILVVFFTADKMGEKSGFSIPLQRILIVGFTLAIALGFAGAVLFQAFYNFMETGVFVINDQTGMTFYGGLIFGAGTFLAVWFVGGRYACKDKKEAVKRFHDIADMAGCMIPLAHAFGRIGCAFAGCCHGKSTLAWYGVRMYTENGWEKVVPVQLFEAVFLFILFGLLLWWYFARRKQTGNTFSKIPLLGVYAIVYGVWRFCIEFMRGDSRGETLVDFLSPSQLIAVIMIIVGALYIAIRLLKLRAKTAVGAKTETGNAQENENKN